MRILILSDGFGGPAYKPRLRPLCDYLHAQGHTVEVYCEKADPLVFAHSYPIREIALYRGNRWDWAVKNFATMLFNWKERAFMRRVEKAIKGKRFDLVFCTSVARGDAYRASSAYPLRARPARYGGTGTCQPSALFEAPFFVITPVHATLSDTEHPPPEPRTATG